MGPIGWSVYRRRRSGLAPPALSGGALRCVLGPVDARGVAPQSLEVVVLALLVGEHVHHDVDVVQEDPAPLGLALAADRLAAELAKRLLDLLDDRSDLA